MTILGLWDGHDSGAALFVGGRLVAAINEERLSRRKLEIVFPTASIATCLHQAGVRAEDVDIVAASTTDPAKTLGRLLPSTKERYYRVRRRQVAPSRTSSLIVGLKRRITEWRPNVISRRLSAALLRRQLADLGFSRARLQLFDHHECHARAAAHASGFDRCTVVTIDGLGDGVSATVSQFAEGQLRRVTSSPARDSLGVFFEQVTQLLNMRELEDEGKVMALAVYAADTPGENPLASLFSVRDGRIIARRPARTMLGDLKRTLWSAANERFALFGQRTVEQVYVALIRSAVQLTGAARIAIAGGVASNIKANRLVRLLPEIDDVYVFPHMGDGGLAVGAAMAACAREAQVPVFPSDTLALGPAFDDQAIVEAIDRAGLCRRQPADISAEVAERLHRGQIVCWFQGGMEYGPRALGHRSILARPDSADLKDRLNLILKRRVWYQPFCPSVLLSEAPRLFDDWTDAGRRNWAMTMAYQVKREWRAALAGVTGIDGSCRPQLVADEPRGPYSAVLQAIKAATGVGAILNTSFNIHGEPLVCDPSQAVDVFRRGGADALAIGPFLVTDRRS